MKRVVEKGTGNASMNKSKFVAYLFPCASEEAIPSLLAEIKKSSPKADHYPYAYAVGGKKKSSDDGEPGGTGGRPLLQLLEGECLDQAFLCVARYFGGTKLGTGNLRRCFVEAGADAIANARLGEEKERYAYSFSVSYSDYEALKRLSSRAHFVIENAVFGENVETTLSSGDKLDAVFETLRIAPAPEATRQIVIVEIPNNECH